MVVGGLTYTAHPCGIELKVRRALTYVGSPGVDADPIDAEGWVRALVHV